MDTSFLKAIPQAATSPFALLAYAIAAVLTISGGQQLSQLRAVLRASKKVQGRTFSELVRSITGSPVPPALSPDQWIAYMRLQAVYRFSMALLVVIGVIVLVAIVRRRDNDPVAKPDPETHDTGSASVPVSPVKTPPPSASVQNIRDLSAILDSRLKKLVYAPVATPKGFVLNCTMEYSPVRKSSCMPQGPVDATIVEVDKKIIDAELLLDGPGTLREAAQENAGSGFSLTQVDVRVIFTRMGAVELVQSVEATAKGPDGQDHHVPRDATDTMN